MSKDRDSPSESSVVLVVDDDSVFRTRLCRAFRERGWEAHDAGNAERALRLAAQVSPDLVLLDLNMPDINGLELIQAIKGFDLTIAIIILTGYGSIATAMQALRLGADHYLSKPVDVLFFNPVAFARSEGAIQGIVLAKADGSLVAGDETYSEGAGTREALETTATNEGRFMFPRLNSGQYVLTVDRAGFQRQRYEVFLSPREVQDITLELELQTVLPDTAARTTSMKREKRSYEHAAAEGDSFRVPPHFAQNLSIRWDAIRMDDRPRVALQFSVENLTDSVYVVAKESIFTPGQYSIPRLYSASIKIRF